ncbi:unnamed protein product [Prunus armeniaca]|uniref:Uncharacterized protein n=1 Tax=Prunus armeniaca TaxID=36596 RepID=A0A6J5Y0L0_PRUAR|nr:unnamed protein product [Prunus armeniaca]
MNSQSSSPIANGGRDHAVITIVATDSIQTTPMDLDQRIQETRWLLHPSAGNESCCIFKVRQCLVEINKKAYQPHIVSSGPYHYGDQLLEMMQQHKWRFLHDLLARTPSNGPTLDHRLQVVAAMEEDIRGCYSETISLCSHDLIEMMVLDGLLTIELFCKVGRLSPSDPDDPIFNLACDHSPQEEPRNVRPLVQLIKYAKKPLEGTRKAMQKFVAGRKGNTSPSIEFIQSAKKLRQAGIKFKTREAKIVKNYLGTDEEVVHFFKNLGKDVSLNIGEAAVILLLLTAIQAFYAVYGYALPPKPGKKH